jgi:hypothetical protein
MKHMHALLDIPNYDIDGFKHVGDRKIRLYGGGGTTTVYQPVVDSALTAKALADQEAAYAAKNATLESDYAAKQAELKRQQEAAAADAATAKTAQQEAEAIARKAEAERQQALLAQQAYGSLSAAVLDTEGGVYKGRVDPTSGALVRNNGAPLTPTAGEAVRTVDGQILDQTAPTQTDLGTPRPMGTTFTDIGGRPQVGGPTMMSAAKIKESEGQFLDEGSVASDTATTATTAQAAPSGTVAAPAPLTTSTYQADTATPAVQKAVSDLQPAKGAVSEQAQVTAATQAPTTTAVGTVQAAQLGAAQQVQAPAARTVQEGEMVSSAVDMAKAEQVAKATEAAAAQGVVTEEQTVQGQLNKLMTDFDAGAPPAWASASLRAATATLAARGLGTSSLAGQAVIQAALESAIPIASADAQAYQQMALQNLSNRQQTAVLAAQQRAAFLGQEFDQQFQARVTNAAKIADIANLNFNAQQQIALENAQLAQSVDLANLSNNQAVVMAKAAQISQLETQNLSNQQQAAVANAQAFLQMDMANLDNAQQTALFKAQQITQSLLSDQAATNAAKQFNASSQNQTDQFMANLTAQVSQFNVAQQNAVNQFNTDQANAIAKFNAEAQNARTQFNASQRLVIDQSNAQWRRDISTTNTAAVNAANMLNAQNLQEMTMAEYNNEVQLYRDQVEMAWSSAEKEADRANAIIIQQIAVAGSLNAAEAQADSDLWGSLFKVGTKLLLD